MSGLEDRVREAYLAAAELVREDAVPARAPTPSAGSQPRAVSASGAKNRPARRARWIAPVSAAAAVGVIAVTVGVIVPHVLAGQHARPRAQVLSGQHARPRAHSPAAAQTHTATIPGLPEFTVVSTETSLEVMQTATGHVTGRVSTPAGQIFARLAGDGSDRMFYVAAQQADLMAPCRSYFYRFSLNAAGQASALTQLTVSGRAGLPTALAASADGSKLAFSITGCANEGAANIPPSQANGYIGLLDMASGRVTRSWTYTAGDDYATSMTLTPDGSLLAFAQLPLGESANVAKKLATDAPSGTVDQASTVVGLPGVSSLSAGPDLYGCIAKDLSPDKVANELGVYDPATGHRTALVHTWRGFEAFCSLAPNSVHGNVLVGIDARRQHGPGPFVPVVIVRVLAIDVSTGQVTTLLTTTTSPSDAGTPTLVGW